MLLRADFPINQPASKQCSIRCHFSCVCPTNFLSTSGRSAAHHLYNACLHAYRDGVTWRRWLFFTVNFFSVLYLRGNFDPVCTFFYIKKKHNLRGDLSDITAKTATLVTHLNDVVFLCMSDLNIEHSSVIFPEIKFSIWVNHQFKHHFLCCLFDCLAVLRYASSQVQAWFPVWVYISLY